MINRDDMLELTRRMTPARSCFDRSADKEKIDIFHANPGQVEEGLMHKLLGK